MLVDLGLRAVAIEKWRSTYCSLSSAMILSMLQDNRRLTYLNLNTFLRIHLLCKKLTSLDLTSWRTIEITARY
jgi:hypothetical protein